jgi:aminoglycoside phosphotransferase family enzyme/predicted kinase
VRARELAPRDNTTKHGLDQAALADERLTSMEEDLSDELKAAGFALIETHISRVFLRAADVYKLKRPVSLGFLDFSTLALREQACLAEVELNRRLSADVYLGVVAVVRQPTGTLAFVERDEQRAEGDAHVLEWAVHMRRLDDRQRADSLLAAGSFGVRDVKTIAVTIAAFHRAAAVSEAIAKFASPESIEYNVRENFVQIAEHAAAYLSADEHAQLVAYQTRFLADQREHLVARARAGFVRDGHGDLRLEHCYRGDDGAYAIIDCIEFNERFRYGDVCADLAFLAMDLSYHGRPELADSFVAAYAHASSDYGVYALLDFYQSYRATVRAKVSTFLANDDGVSEATRQRAQHEARRYFLLAITAGQRPLRAPRLLVTFGLIASGKSTVAAALAERLGAAQLSADYTRKELLGLRPEQPRHEAAFSGAYDSSFTEQVYATLFTRAALILRTGRCVVLDATFRSRAQREQARELASKLAADLLFVECHCDRALAMERLRTRADGASASDGRAEIYDAFAASFEPASELTPATHLSLDTAQPLAATLTRIYAELG